MASAPPCPPRPCYGVRSASLPHAAAMAASHRLAFALARDQLALAPRLRTSVRAPHSLRRPRHPVSPRGASASFPCCVRRVPWPRRESQPAGRARGRASCSAPERRTGHHGHGVRAAAHQTPWALLGRGVPARGGAERPQGRDAPASREREGTMAAAWGSGAHRRHGGQVAPCMEVKRELLRAEAAGAGATVGARRAGPSEGAGRGERWARKARVRVARPKPTLAHVSASVPKL
ncbi:hypothetical protein BS78_10G280000 [Paspalum vaginatum]|nr:hypothetical protein BS78_10G280000 [Paspalum vaginatum]